MELVVPMGALAHAAAALEQSTGGRVLEVRLANAAGAPAFEAAIAQHDAVVYMRIEYRKAVVRYQCRVGVLRGDDEGLHAP